MTGLVEEVTKYVTKVALGGKSQFKCYQTQTN